MLLFKGFKLKKSKIQMFELSLFKLWLSNLFVIVWNFWKSNNIKLQQIKQLSFFLITDQKNNFESDFIST
jgi:hypothetical protein